LVIVLWVSLGLVSLALYFGHSMTLELRAADNRLASLEAEQAIDGAARYAGYLLTHLEEPGRPPELQTYQREAAVVGEASFWFVGRDNQRTATDQPVFGLVDEASKLNLNTATQQMLEALPGMTAELAAAIIDWRDADNDVSEGGGAEEQTYLLRTPSYRCKNGRFESVDELRLVLGADLEILSGEDWNRNGVLDPNENDGTATPPADNRDGRLDAGIFEYLTVYSRESNTNLLTGTNRVSVTGAGAAQRLAPVLQNAFGANRANQILQPLTGPNGTFRSPLEFYVRSHQRQNGMTADEFAQIADSLTVTNGTYVEGLVNVNTASEAVLACLPGVGTDRAASLVNYRQSNSANQLRSVAWIAEVLDANNAIQLGPYITARSYQYTADVAAVGRLGRGYRRTRFVFDTADGTPRLVYRQDLSHLGWALGRRARLESKLPAGTRSGTRTI
jgi:DNA uptake protein ComE-like DNA-binding protein